MTSTADRVDVGYTLPSPEDIGVDYDQFMDLHAMIAGDLSLHIAMFTRPGERAPASTLPDLLNRAQEATTLHHLEMLALQPGDHLLDIGCGAGTPAVTMSRRSGARVTGINVSRAQLARAEERAHAAGVTDRVTFRYGDAQALEFADGSFDAATSIEVFAHLSDPQRAFDEAARVLRPGGHFLVSEFTLRGTPTPEITAAFQHTWHSSLPGRASETLARAENAGFELVRAESMTQNTAMSGEAMGLLYVDRRQEIQDVYGPEAVAELDHVMPMVRTFFREHLGSYLYLLRKP